MSEVVCSVKFDFTHERKGSIRFIKRKIQVFEIWFKNITKAINTVNAFDPVIQTLGISPKMQLETDLFKILINDSLQTYPKFLKHSFSEQRTVKYIIYTHNKMVCKNLTINCIKNN